MSEEERSTAGAITGNVNCGINASRANTGHAVRRIIFTIPQPRPSSVTLAYSIGRDVQCQPVTPRPVTQSDDKHPPGDPNITPAEQMRVLSNSGLAANIGLSAYAEHKVIAADRSGDRHIY